MSKLIDDILRDREAGTPGPWALSKGQEWLMDSGGEDIAEIFGGTDEDARRIARVPDMEAALLAAEELANATRARQEQYVAAGGFAYDDAVIAQMERDALEAWEDATK